MTREPLRGSKLFLPKEQYIIENFKNIPELVKFVAFFRLQVYLLPFC